MKKSNRAASFGSRRSAISSALPIDQTEAPDPRKSREEAWKFLETAPSLLTRQEESARR